MNNIHLKTITLNGAPLNSTKHVLSALKHAFQYSPEYCGTNLDACIDILSSLRILEDQMTLFHLDDNEAIALQVQHFEAVPPRVKETLFTIVSAVNARAQEIGQRPLIYLLLTEDEALPTP